MLGLAAIAVVTAIGVVLVATYDGGDGGTPSTKPVLSDEELAGGGQAPVQPVLARGIEVRVSIIPRTILFGDTIAGYVDVMVDRRRVDPSSVRVSTDFVPWEVVGEPERVRRDGATTHLRTTFRLRCTSSPCLPANQSAALEFNRARVSFARVGADAAERTSLGVEWPLLLVYSRFAIANVEGPTGPANPNPWRADFLSLPAVSFRVSPGVLVVVLLVFAGILGVAGVALAYVAIPRRVPALEPEPEPEPEVILTPLEQALVLLEDANRTNGVEDRRRALELVFEVLVDDQPELARAARALAWSEDAPLVEDTSGLASRVRTIIDLNGNGRAE